MKKVLLSLLALLFVFTLVGCGKKEEAKKDEAKEATPTVCNGPINAVYEGLYEATEGKFNIHEEVTVTLKDDGTYSVMYKDSEGYDGTYTLKDNVLRITHQDGMNISVIEYEVKEDCSQVTWGEPGSYQYIISKK